MTFYKDVYICSPKKDILSDRRFWELAAHLMEMRVEHSTPSSFRDIGKGPYIAICLIDKETAQLSRWIGYVSAFKSAGDKAAVILYCPDDRLPSSIAKDDLLGSAPCAKTLQNCVALVRKTLARSGPLPNARTLRHKTAEAREHIRQEQEKDEALAQANRQGERLSHTLQEQAKSLNTLKALARGQQEKAEALHQELESAQSTIEALETQLHQQQRPRVSFTGMFLLFSLDILFLFITNFEKAGVFGYIRTHLSPMYPQILCAELVNAILLPFLLLTVLRIALGKGMSQDFAGAITGFPAVLWIILSCLIIPEWIGTSTIAEAPILWGVALLWIILRPALLTIAAGIFTGGEKE